MDMKEEKKRMLMKQMGGAQMSEKEMKAMDKMPMSEDVDMERKKQIIKDLLSSAKKSMVASKLPGVEKALDDEDMEVEGEVMVADLELEPKDDREELEYEPKEEGEEEGVLEQGFSEGMREQERRKKMLEDLFKSGM